MSVEMVNWAFEAGVRVRVDGDPARQEVMLLDLVELCERCGSLRELWSLYRRLPKLAAVRGIRRVDLRVVRQEIRRTIGVIRRLELRIAGVLS